MKIIHFCLDTRRSWCCKYLHFQFGHFNRIRAQHTSFDVFFLLLSLLLLILCYSLSLLVTSSALLSTRDETHEILAKKKKFAVQRIAKPSKRNKEHTNERTNERMSQKKKIEEKRRKKIFQRYVVRTIHTYSYIKRVNISRSRYLQKSVRLHSIKSKCMYSASNTTNVRQMKKKIKMLTRIIIIKNKIHNNNK